MEREFAYFLAECLSEPLRNFFNQSGEIISFKLFPSLFIAIDLVIKHILFNEFFNNCFFALLRFFRHGIRNLFHLFDNLPFGVLLESLYCLIELQVRCFDCGLFFQILIFVTALVKFFAVTVIIFGVLFGNLLVNFVINLKLIITFQFWNHVQDQIILRDFKKTCAFLFLLFLSVFRS